MPDWTSSASSEWHCGTRSPSSALFNPFFGWEGSPTKIDVRERVRVRKIRKECVRACAVVYATVHGIDRYYDTLHHITLCYATLHSKTHDSTTPRALGTTSPLQVQHGGPPSLGYTASCVCAHYGERCQWDQWRSVGSWLSLGKA